MVGKNKMMEIRMPAYNCKKHGNIGNHIVSFDIARERKKDKRDYCLYCFEDMVDKYCYKAIEDKT